MPPPSPCGEDMWMGGAASVHRDSLVVSLTALDWDQVDQLQGDAAYPPPSLREGAGEIAFLLLTHPR